MNNSALTFFIEMSRLKYFCFVLFSVATIIKTNLVFGQSQSKPRLIVLTDISSLSQGEAEPDDGQSMVRLMLYSNDLALEGLIATSNLRHGQRTRPELIRQVVDSYAQVRPNLIKHDENYPTADQLRNLVKSGQAVAGPKVPVEQSIGQGKDTEGSNWIIEVVDKDDTRPVWISIWGGSADLAQALWKVRATRTPAQVTEFVRKLRIHSVYDQDMTGPWIRAEFPALFFILRNHGIRGMYRGGDTTLVRAHWVKTNIRDHGALGNLYVNYNGGDLWGRQLGKFSGIKEGDTPSFLYLLTNGLNSPEHPEWGNWGGRFVEDESQKDLWLDATDSIGNYKSDMDPRMAAVYRWRPAWQADFAARLDWCVKDHDEANHAPRVNNGQEEVNARSGEQVKLSVKASDPDKDKLRYNWFFYPEEGTYRGEFPQLSARGRTATFTAPKLASAKTLHVIVEVRDDGTPALTSYHRYIVTVNP